MTFDDPAFPMSDEGHCPNKSHALHFVQGVPRGLIVARSEGSEGRASSVALLGKREEIWIKGARARGGGRATPSVPAPTEWAFRSNGLATWAARLSG